jgi:hypothetical protein
MKGLLGINIDGTEKVRKALISVSITMILLSNIELASNEINFFGLRILVSLEKILSVLKLVTIFLIFATALHALEQLPLFVYRIRRYLDRKWWDKLLPEIIESQHGPLETEDRILDWDDEAYHERHLRSAKRKRIAAFYRPTAIVIRFCTRQLFPIFLAAIALFNPEIILVLQ